MLTTLSMQQTIYRTLSRATITRISNARFI